MVKRLLIVVIMAVFSVWGSIAQENALYEGDSLTFEYPSAWRVGVDTPNHLVVEGDGAQVDVFASLLGTDRLPLNTVIQTLSQPITANVVELTEAIRNEKPSVRTEFEAEGVTWILSAFEAEDGAVVFVRAFFTQPEAKAGIETIINSARPTQNGSRTYLSPEGYVQFSQPLGFDINQFSPMSFLLANTSKQLPDPNGTTPVESQRLTFIIIADVSQLQNYTPTEGDTPEKIVSAYLNEAVCADCEATFSAVESVTFGTLKGAMINAQFKAFDARAYAVETATGHIVVVGVYSAPNEMPTHENTIAQVVPSIQRILYGVPATADTRETFNGFTLVYPSDWVADSVGDLIRIRTSVGVGTDAQRLRTGQMFAYVFPTFDILQTVTGYTASSDVNVKASTVALYFATQNTLAGGQPVGNITNGTVGDRELAVIELVPQDQRYSQWVAVIEDGNGGFYTLFAFAPSDTVQYFIPLFNEIIAKFNQSE